MNVEPLTAPSARRAYFAVALAAACRMSFHLICRAFYEQLLEIDRVDMLLVWRESLLL